MAKEIDCPENLCAHARREPLSEQQRGQLDGFLRESPDLRTAFDVGIEFDRVGAVQSGDEALIQRIVARGLLRTRKQSTHRFRRSRLVSMALAAVSVASAAAALGLLGANTFFTKPRTAFNSTTLARRADIPPATMERSTVQEARPSSRLALPTSTVPRTTSRVPIQVRSGSDLVTAASLLERANQARGALNVPLAVALYTELQTQFSSSREAHLSYVSLGKMLLQNGKPQAALRQFSSYLGRGGTLDAEALAGKARCLSALKRDQEEVVAWRQLLARFPTSVYVGAARQRLDALDGSTE